MRNYLLSILLLSASPALALTTTCAGLDGSRVALTTDAGRWSVLHTTPDGKSYERFQQYVVSAKTDDGSTAPEWSGVNVRRPHISMRGVLSAWTNGSSYVEKTFKDGELIGTGVFSCDLREAKAIEPQKPNTEASQTSPKDIVDSESPQNNKNEFAISTLAMVAVSFRPFMACVSERKGDLLKAASETIKDAGADAIASLAGFASLTACSKSADDGASKCSASLPQTACMALTLRLAGLILRE